MADGHKTALELALEAWREVEVERRVQGDLFEAPDQALVDVEPGPRGRGRPIGSRNKRTDELAAWYIQQNEGRHPLQRGIEVAGLPILAKGVLEGLAERLGMSRADAAKWWAGILSTTLPYCAPRQSSIEIRPAGAPGSGQPILWTLDEEGELIDATHDGKELAAITSTG